MLVLNEVISQDKTSGSIMMSKSQSSKNLAQAKVVNKSIEKKSVCSLIFVGSNNGPLSKGYQKDFGKFKPIHVGRI